MSGFVVTASTSAAPHTVWEVLTAVDAYPDVVAAIVRVERVGGGHGFVVGTRWRETRTPLSNEVTELKQVTALDPTAMTYVVEHESHGTTYRDTVHVSSVFSGSTVTVTCGLERPGRLAKLAAKASAKAYEFATRQLRQQDLDDVLAAAEAR